MPLPAYYHSNPNLNVSINGINIGEGMQRADMNNALRQIMADMYDWTITYSVTYPISIANGGTGAITAAAALAALGGLPLAGGTVTGQIVRATAGVYPFFASTAMTGGEIYLQPLGVDPTINPGDIVFEY